MFYWNIHGANNVNIEYLAGDKSAVYLTPGGGDEDVSTDSEEGEEDKDGENILRILWSK